MALENVSDFWEWFDSIRGDLSIRQIEERARCPRGRIGNAYSARKEPSPLICESIADGLGISRERVFRKASILPALPPEMEEEREVMRLFRQLSQPFRHVLLELLRALALSGPPIVRTAVGEETMEYMPTVQQENPRSALEERWGIDALEALWDIASPEQQAMIVEKILEAREEARREREKATTEQGGRGT